MNKRILSLIAGAALAYGGATWAQMGPGMMGEYGWGMGPGMMGGYGPGGGMMGPGMWGGYGLQSSLTDEQHSKIAAIQDDFARKRWDLMGRMEEESFKLQQFYSAGKRDESAINAVYKRMSELRRQMFDTNVDARKKMEAVLTKEQREQMRRGWRGGWGW